MKALQNKAILSSLVPNLTLLTNSISDAFMDVIISSTYSPQMTYFRYNLLSSHKHPKYKIFGMVVSNNVTQKGLV